MAAGWTEYWDKIKAKFDDGKKVMLDWLKSVETTISTVFSDLLTGQLKSFKDYFQSFANAIAKTWSDMMATMVMDYLKGMLRIKSSSGGSTGLLGSIFKVIANLFSPSIPQIDLSPGSVLGPAMKIHTGGPVVKMHEGGLRRDEVIAKLLSNEYVLRREAAQSIGRERLDYMNQTGQMPEKKEKQPIEIRIMNILDPTDVLAQGIADNPNLIINPVCSNYNRNAEMRKTLLVDR